jgi:hypothetical protein
MRSAERIYVGKAPTNHPVPQGEIINEDQKMAENNKQFDVSVSKKSKAQVGKTLVYNDESLLLGSSKRN